MTEGDEEIATFFVNFMTKNGLVGRNTWAAAAAPQEKMYTRREWDKPEMLGNLAVGKLVDFVLTSETVQDKSCSVDENTFMRDHKAVSWKQTVSKKKRSTQTKRTSKTGNLHHNGERRAKT